VLRERELGIRVTPEPVVEKKSKKTEAEEK